MSTAVKSQLELLTAEEFGKRTDPGFPEELVRGRIEKVSPPPRARHGQVCCEIARILGNHATKNNIGRVLTNDSGVITQRDPDTVRGADIAFYSYDRLPRGPLPSAYLDVPPDLVFEVLSPDDRWSRVLTKVAEYLNVGVKVVGVLDPDRGTLHVFEPDQPVRMLSESDEFALPEVLGDLRVQVQRFLD
jgi:Uma2 family endonuclease